MLPDAADPVMQKMFLSQPHEEMHNACSGFEESDLWKKHFAPVGHPKEVAQLPNEWVNFIALALLTPEKFEWAKQLLSSQLWKIISAQSDSSNLKPFVVPDKCDSVLHPLC